MIQGFRRKPKETELNITSFMNLMVILVPFLLISAVFSEITTLQLNLPQQAVGEKQEKAKLQLELILRGNELIINNAAAKQITRLAPIAGEPDLAGLSRALHKIKQEYPQHSEITLLLEPATKYARLIALMDAVRSRVISNGLGNSEVALFPDIAIGDAPADKATESTK